MFGKGNIPKHLPDVGSEASSKPTDGIPIRERLQRWAEAHEGSGTKPMPPDAFIYGSIANNVSRTQSTGSSEMDQIRSTGDNMAETKAGLVDDHSEVSIVGVDSRAPGDLVELRFVANFVLWNCDPISVLRLTLFADNQVPGYRYSQYTWDILVTETTFTL